MLLDGLKDYKQQQNAVKDAKDIKEQILRGFINKTIPDANGYVRVLVKTGKIILPCKVKW